jgi:hypothetical protein
MKNNVAKIYCVKCDELFNSRRSFEGHLSKHTSKVVSEICPIDTIISKLLNFFKKKSLDDLE